MGVVFAKPSFIFSLFSFVRKYRQTNRQTNKETNKQTFDHQERGENMPLGPAVPGLTAKIVHDIVNFEKKVNSRRPQSQYVLQTAPFISSTFLTFLPDN